MKIVTAVTICACLLFFSIDFSQAQQPGDLSSRNRQLAEIWLKDLNLHDTVSLASLYDRDCQLLSPNWEGAKTGQAAVREVYSRYFSSTPDLRHTLTHLLVTDSAAVIEYQSDGTFSHPEKNAPEYMRGKKYSLQNCTILDIRNGKILKQVNYFDQVSFLRQVGFFNQK